MGGWAKVRFCNRGGVLTGTDCYHQGYPNQFSKYFDKHEDSN